jgi:hypothetical protein
VLAAVERARTPEPLRLAREAARSARATSANDVSLPRRDGVREEERDG